MFYEKAKYLVGMMNCDGTPMKIAVMFPDVVFHSHIARLFISVESGGFYRVGRNEDVHGAPTINCYGRSESCSVNSRPEDAEYILRAMSEWTMYHEEDKQKGEIQKSLVNMTAPVKPRAMRVGHIDHGLGHYRRPPTQAEAEEQFRKDLLVLAAISFHAAVTKYRERKGGSLGAARRDVKAMMEAAAKVKAHDEAYPPKPTKDLDL